MTLILDWPPEVVARVTAEAREAGLTVDEYVLKSVVGEVPPVQSELADEETMRQRRLEAGRRIVELSKGNILGPDLTIRDLIEDGRRF